MHVTSWLLALLTPAVICGCGVTNHADRREAEPSSSGFGYVSKPAYLDHVRRVAALEILANEVDPADRVSGGAAVLWAAAIGGVSPCDLVLDASKGDVIITVLDGHGNCHRQLSGSDLLQRRGLEMVLLYGEHRFILHAWTTMKNLLRKRMNGLGYDFGRSLKSTAETLAMYEVEIVAARMENSRLWFETSIGELCSVWMP